MNRPFSTNGQLEDVIKDEVQHYAQPNIITLNFDVFLQSNLDYEKEFVNNENQINEISIVNQIEWFEFVKEIASYVTGTKIDKETSNYTVNSKEYCEAKKIEIESFESLYERINWVEVWFYCTKIIEFLNLRKIELFATKPTNPPENDIIQTKKMSSDIDNDLLKYLSENFTSTDKSFNELTKYNQIYRFLNEGRDYNIEHRAYKNLIKELFSFDYGNREIKGQTQKHLTQLETLENNYSNSKK